MLATFDTETGRAKKVQRMRDWPRVVWKDGNQRSLTVVAIMGVLKDYLAKADSRDLQSFNELAQQLKSTVLTEGSLFAGQEYQLKYDAHYYPVDMTLQDSTPYVLKTSVFNEPTQRFLTRYVEVSSVIGLSGVKVLQDKFKALGLTQLPVLLEGLSLEDIPNSSVKILHAKDADHLAHYLYHTALVYPEFFHQNFDLFEAVLAQVKMQSDSVSTSTTSIQASLVGKAKDFTVGKAFYKGISVPNTIAPDFFERLIDKYLKHIEAASTIPLVGEVTGKATIDYVEHAKFYMYDSKNPEASSPVSPPPEGSQDIGGMFFIAGTKITLQLVKIPTDKKPDIFKLMQDYADNYIVEDNVKSHLKQSKQGVFSIDLEDKDLANALAKELCSILGLTFDTTEKKESTLKKDKGKLFVSS